MLDKLLFKKASSFDIKGTTKKTVVSSLAKLLVDSGRADDLKEVERLILEREAQSSTGFEGGIAIPHIKSDIVKENTLVVAYSKNGVKFDSMDGKPTKLFLFIATNTKGGNTHLEVLSNLARHLMDEKFRNALLNCKTFPQVEKILAGENKGSSMATNNKTGYDIVAVTACPTGIAHTFMAAQALENAAKERGLSIKVQTNGQEGIKNKITASEAKNAKAIILACDIGIDKGAFASLKAHEVKVARAMKEANKVIDEALAGQGNMIAASDDSSNESTGKSTIYQHLMNGVTHMLPFVVAGGILIALSFVFGIKAFDPTDKHYNVFAKFLMDLGGGAGAFGFLVPILSAFIAQSIGGRPGLMPGFIGGLIAAHGGVGNPADAVSAGFLGGLVSGFLAGYTIVALKKTFDFLPQSLNGIKAILIYPVLSLLIVGGVMYYLVIPLAGINTGLNNFLKSLSGSNKIVLGLVIGCMMAFDMGGPVNKAAYVFGTSQIGINNDIMAAVMIAGMVPPLAIALSTTFAPKLWDKVERDGGLSNWIMGLSFITEGAIPFASANPLVIIPSIMTGSAVAGALSFLFNCTLPAPHGGIFVLFLIGNWPMFLGSLFVGALVSMFMINFFKAKQNAKKMNA